MVQKAPTGLREKQKQLRRETILESARRLFEAQGIEDTTMATIAAEAGVSTPTVFNYFGSRDELLLAIIFEGHEKAVDDYRQGRKRAFPKLADDLCELLTGFTMRSLEIFNKSVWRYADSTAIRQPESEFVKRYSQIDQTLTCTIKDVLNEHVLKPRRGGAYDTSALASIIYNHWNNGYINYIKNDAMTLETHLGSLLPEIRELLSLIFEDD